jgi:hypothetical protein
MMTRGKLLEELAEAEGKVGWEGERGRVNIPFRG